MSPSKAFVLIVASVLFFSSLGALIGAALGTFSPGYYRAVFRSGDSPTFDPTQTGIGLGLTQGLAGGVVVGLVLVAILAWREIRLWGPNLSAPTVAPASKRLRGLRWVFQATVVSLLLVIATSVAFLVGEIAGESALYSQLTSEKLTKISNILVTGEFPMLRAHYSDAAQVYLTGSVPDYESRDRLSEKLQSEFGKDEASAMIRLVKVGD